MKNSIIKNYRVVARHRVRAFMFVVMFFTTMLGFSQNSTPVLDAQSNPPQLGACGDAATFTVTLNLGTTAYPNAQLEITIPNDFEYVNGEQTNVGAVNFVSQTGNKVTLNLNIPAHTATQPQMHVTFKAKALCGSIATTAVGATKPRMRYKLTGAGAEQLKEGRDINVLYAVLNMKVDPMSANLPSGESVQRTIVITNTGNSAISSFKIATTLGAGLEITGSDFSAEQTNGWVITNSNGTYQFSGKDLAKGDVVTITQTLKLKGCTDFTSSYTASYGCAGDESCQYNEINQATKSPGISLDNTKKPILEITHIGADGNVLTTAKPGGLCLDTDIYHYIKIENKGQGVAKDLIFTIETSSTGDRFGSTYFIENSYQMADDPAFTQNVETPILTAPMAGDGYKWKAESGSRFGTTGKHWLYEMGLRDIPASGALYVRIKSRNNSATAGCTTTPSNLAYGYIVSKVRYSNANQCVTSAPVTTNQTSINVGQEIDFRGFNEASVSVEGGKVYNGSFNVNKVFATWNGLKKDDYFDIVLQLSPSFTNIQQSSLKLFTNTGVPVNPSQPPIVNGNEVRFRFKYQNDIKPYDNKVWSGADFSINGLKIKFDATYNCGTTVGGDPAWYKLNMELKRTESCGTSFTMPTRCIKVDLTPYGCSSGCADGFVREIPTIERTVYGFEPTDPDNQGVPKYDGSGNLIPINPDTYTRTLQKSSFHIGDRIRFKQSGKVNKTTADQWTQGQFSFPMPENLHADANPLTIIDPQSVILTLQRAGATYTATALGLIQTGNKTITVNFDIPTLQAKGFPPSIADFQNGDVLTISMDMTPNKFGHTSQGQKLFYPNFKLIHNGTDVVCGPPGIANSYYGITRFTLNVYPYGDQYPTNRQILECERGAHSYFYFDTLMNEIIATNAMFPNEHRTFLRPKKIWFNVPKGLILTGVKIRLDGQGSANFHDTHIDIDADSNDGNDAQVTDNANYGFDLEKALRTLINNKVGHGDKPLHIDEGYRIFIVPEVKLNCYSGEAEVLSMEMELEGTGHSVNHSGFTHFNQTNIRTIRREIKYLADNDKITTSVAQPNYVGNTNEVRWVVQVANSSTFHKFTNLWIASTDMEITSVQEVTNATGNIPMGIPFTKETSGIFKLGELATTKTRFFLVKSNISDCGQGDRTILFGQGCEGYPNAIDADSPCVKKLPVKYAKTEAAFQVKIISQPPADYRPNLCDQIEYDIEINNSGAGLAKDIHLDIPLGTDQGLFFVSGSAYISQKYTTGTQSTTGSWANANVTSANDIISIGLATNTLSIGEKIRVRFKVQTTSDCKFASHQKLQFIPKGKNFCGSEIININSATSDNLIIEGDTSNRPVVIINQSTAVVTFNEIGATGKPSAKYTLKFSNEGSASNADPINANAKLAIKLPTGWTFNSLQEIVTKSAGKLEYEGLQDDFYVYKLLTPVIKGQFLELNDVSMEFTGIFPCNIAQEIHTELYYVIDAGVFGSSCSPTPSCNLKTIIVERKMPLEISLPKAILKTGANTEFCGAKTVADLSNLIEQNANLAWYTTATGGTALASTHQIITTTYYVALKDALTGCESAERLAVSVTIKEQSERGHITKTEDAFCNVTSVTVAQLKSHINNQGNEDGEIKIYEIDPATQVPTTLKVDADELTAGQMYAYTRTQAGKCESVYNHITLTIGKSATPVALTETLCGAISVDNLKAKFVVPVGATIKVYLGSSEVTSGDLMAGNYQVSVVENGKCESNKQNVIIHTSADVPTFTIVNKDCTTLGSVTISNYNGINTYEFSDTALTMDTTGNITGFVYGQAYTVTVTAAGGCQAQATFTVNDTCVIDAVDDTFAPVSGTVGGEAGNVLSDNGNGKDKLGSEDATTSNVQISVVTPAGTGNVPQLDTTTGKVTVPAGTPAGTYTIVYKICDNNNLSNCDTATVTVKVININTGDDEFTYENGSLSGSGNILDNDKYNGTIPSIPVEVDLTTSALPEGITVSPTGDILVSNAKSGIYTFTYQLCSKVLTDVCDSATVTITVKNRIEANDDDNGDSVNGYNLVPNSTIDIFANDRLDGKGVSSQTVTITTHTSLPVGVTIDVNGKVTIGSDTPTGLHSFTYTLCEKGVTPANCDTAKVIFTVKNIDAVDDDFGVQTVGTTTKTVFENDKLNGVVPTSATVSVTSANLPIGVTLNSDGTLTIGNTALSGTHTFTYTICDKANTSICDTATATVTIKKVVATDDSYSITDTTVTQTVGNVLDNDKVGTQTATTTLVTIGNIQNPTGSNVPALDTNGNITIPQGTLPNIYTITYEICLSGGSTDCDTAEVQVVVGTPTLTVANDTYTATTIATPRVVGNVLSNDEINGHTPVLPSFVNIGVKQPATPIGAGVTPTLSTITGDVEVPANTPAGVYTIVYELCPKGIATGSASCKTATVTVTVTAPTIVALPNTYTATTTDTTQTVGNVFDNDSLGGVSVSTSTVILTPGVFTHPNITMGTDGNITISSNTPSGTYTGTYTICDRVNASNCTSTTVTIVVTAVTTPTVITATDDPVTVTTTQSGTVVNVLDNDRLGTKTPTTSDVTITVTSTPTGTIVPNLDPVTGNVTVPSGTPTGTYTIGYRICTKSGTITCATATVVITVTEVVTPTNTTVAKDDFRTTYVNTQVSGSVAANDLDPEGDTQVWTTQTNTTGGHTFVLNADGTYTFTPSTDFVGTVSYTYEVCDNGTPQACATATIYISVRQVVTPTATSDTFTATTSTNTQTVGNVLNNDRIGTNTPTTFDVTITVTKTPTGTIVPNLDPVTGNVTVPSGTPTGTYTIGYSICTKVGTITCDTATVTVVVTEVTTPTTPTVVTATDDVVTVTTTQSGTVVNVLDNDKIGTNTPTTSDVTITVTSTPTGAIVPNLDPVTGDVTIPSGTPTGTYTIGYSICTKSATITCATATVVITVTEVVTPTNTTVAKDDINNTYVNTPVSGSVGTNDLDPEGDTQVWTIQTNTVGGHTFVLNADGRYTFTPSTDFVGTVSYTYEVCDNGTPQACATATISIQVLPKGINSLVANDDTAVTKVNTGVLISVLSNDFDPEGDTFSVTKHTNPSHGTVALNADGTFTYTPTTDFVGEDEFTYIICDGNVTSTCATARVHVSVVSTTTNITVANDDAYNTDVNVAVVGNVLNNDTDPEGDTVTTTVVTTPSNGTLSLSTDGTFTYTPTTNFVGTDSFTYRVCDSGTPQACDEATVYITVKGVVATPTANSDTFTATTSTNTQTVGNVLDNDKLGTKTPTTSDVTITVTSTPTGTIVPNLDAVTGNVTVPSGTPTGTYVIGYEICTKSATITCDTATVTIVVTEVTTPTTPVVAKDDVEQTVVDTPVTVKVVSNDEHVPTQGTLTIVTQPKNGTVVINDNGTTNDPSDDEVVYTPNRGYAGVDSFEYELCDTMGNCSIAKVTITVLNDVIPHNGISVNGDGLNDYFHIQGIERYPNNTVRIYNRWGVKVFETKGYDNVNRVFRAISNGRVTIEAPEKLPQGTYYYIIEYTDNNNKKHTKGSWLYIKK
ncbi:Ig-like domain-containing protein [Capnocytophaga canis]|uniref:Ig-like domain-containing protein n=1 Tax=Capnocytophaga canis TaxID=1848903 RepID=UPI00370DA71E